MAIIRETAEMSETERLAVRNNNMEFLFNLIYTIQKNEHPLFSFFVTSDDIDPAMLYGGKWKLIQDRVLVGAGNLYSVGSTGGETEHTLTVDEMPEIKVWSYNSEYSADPDANIDALFDQGNYLGIRSVKLGGGQPHNNMPPYLAVYIWQRIA